MILSAPSPSVLPVPEPHPFRLAAIHYPRAFDVDRVLAEACAHASSRGLRLGGLVQVVTGDRGGNCAATVHVVDLRTRARFDIWEDRGACASGCRLDERGLVDAEPAILGAVADRVDLVVINRFGRAESLGRGLRACFEAAVLADVPVLTAVRAPYDEAWRTFHGGLADEIACEAAAVAAWLDSLGAHPRPAEHGRSVIA